MRADAMDNKDVAMIERPNRLGFLFESPQSILVFRKRRGQHFDRYVAINRLLIKQLSDEEIKSKVARQSNFSD